VAREDHQNTVKKKIHNSNKCTSTWTNITNHKILQVEAKPKITSHPKETLFGISLVVIGLKVFERMNVVG
jgi:hypothetical protein